jgi:hypothetical protein
VRDFVYVSEFLYVNFYSSNGPVTGNDDGRGREEKVKKKNKNGGGGERRRKGETKRG